VTTLAELEANAVPGGPCASSEEMRAVLRVVRAAESYRETHEGYQCDGPDGQCEWRCDEAKELIEALAPFGEESL
jgi:hypothetical protein